MPTPSRPHLLTCALIALTAGCSFEIPPEIAELPEQLPDMIAPLRDMDRDQARDQDVPDMPREDLRDMPREDLSDMQPDMPSDMSSDMPRDMVVRLGELGESCVDDAGCQEGSCKALGGESFCALPCVQGACTTFGFKCVQQVCAPDTFCADDGVTGPGCKTCARCADDAQCNEILDENGETIYQCVCPEGYYGDGLTCTDRDECAEGIAQCVDDATCVNTSGGFDCLCDAGFEGDGEVSCTPIQMPCDMCASQATCVTNAQNQQQCECNAGWAGNGVTCQDLDECLTPGQCGANANCVNLPGTFTCECQPGFEPDQGLCLDVDECAQSPCDALATCVNTQGAFQCDCPVGVAGNGLTCQPYASCAELALANPGAPSGDYWIRTTNGTQLEVYCDMDSDAGAGYTLHRVDAANLNATQQAYASTCSSLGMEIVTPRSQEHMQAIIAWNGGSPPNIVNVFPSGADVKGLSNYVARCSGQSCSFFANGREHGRCRTLIDNGSAMQWSSQVPAKDCQAYLADAATPATTGSYVIDPDGPGGRPPFTTLCGMNLDGGGWTLAATTSDDGVDTWTWNNRDLWTSDEGDVGSAPAYNADYKNASVHDLEIKDLLFIHNPSFEWATYYDVAQSPGDTISSLLDNASAPTCDPSVGLPMGAGTITDAGSLCSTDLYLHAGDYDQNGLNFGPARCAIYRTPDSIIDSSVEDDSTWGFGWSQSNNDPCPFDDPAYSSWGARQWDKDEETNALGFGLPLGLNTQPPGMSLNYMWLFSRGDRPLEPSGDNTVQDRLVLEASPTGDAGPDCPYGSWEDRGNQVLDRGWVICGINE